MFHTPGFIPLGLNVWSRVCRNSLVFSFTRITYVLVCFHVSLLVFLRTIDRYIECVMPAPYMHDKILMWYMCLWAPCPAYLSVIHRYRYVYIFWFLRVTYISAPLCLDNLVGLIHWLGGPSLAPVLPRYPVPRPWSCLAICIYIYISLALVISRV